jgi:hypothetical protein
MDYNIPSPCEIKSKLDEAAEAEVVKIVPQIVEMLEREYIGPPVNFTLKDKNLSAKARARVIAVFDEAGWDVKFQDDQREGAWLEFSAKAVKPL